MPLYDFECGACGHQQELLRKVSAPAVEVCPQCKQPQFAKKLSAPHFQLTGSGWYATDFKQGGRAPHASSAETATENATASCAPGCACH